MNFCRHIPAQPLAQSIEWFWYYDGLNPDHRREHVLPDGTFELIINLQEEPRKLFDREDTTQFRSFRRAWLSGTQSEYLIIDALPNSSMMGLHFRPGGVAPFLDLPANELRDQVVELSDLWGPVAEQWRERLLGTPGPDAKFRLLEQLLLERLSRNRRPKAARKGVQWAVSRMVQQPDVPSIRSVAEDLGISHKHFIREFRSQVGLTPKLFCRIRRFQQVLAQVGSQRRVEWADLAYSCGYYDQAHFVNDFQDFSGLNPTTFLSQRMDYPGFARALE